MGHRFRIPPSPQSVLASVPETHSASWNLQNERELTNFFERRVSAYQVGVTGDVAFSQEF